ncbi:hypothetical protein LCGC14_1346840 [marine sediment metagenome]|uniref:Uncharacterized protein n=1 Tax=marine sediment metagenome TaxID=412755 RepID=A0A0F9MSS8_9ZZZZ
MQYSFAHVRWRAAMRRFEKARRLHRGQKRAWRKLHRWATTALREEMRGR